MTPRELNWVWWFAVAILPAAVIVIGSVSLMRRRRS